MKRIISDALVMIFILIPFSGNALETSTHEAINNHISRGLFQGFSLGQYLKDELKIQGGVEELFVDSVEPMRVWQWLRAGGTREDKPPGGIPYLRSMNHFHNPLTDQGFLTGESSLFWAQKGIGTQSPGGYYSWNDVRLYFYKALTLPTRTERDSYFAKMFRGLGQLMHLVQDLSVPEHARNEFHPISKYEKWMEKNHNMIGNVLPLYFNESKIRNLPVLGNIPIGNLFDTNQYKNPTPDPTLTLRDDIGLSEYTSANFLSSQTIFKTDEFPYPSWNSVVENPETDPVTGKKKIYLKKQGAGETIDHLVVGRRFYKYLPSSIWDLAMTFDDKVHKDYADRLLPRAVGYSAGLLKYFFRGKLDVLPLGPGNIKIKNLSSESMNGTFWLYYDANDGTRRSLGSWQLTIGAGGSSNPVAFGEPPDAAEPGEYVLVFKGQLGNEPNPVAVAGKVWSVKYHWSLVVDYPPRSYYRYSTNCEEISYRDCGTVVGDQKACNRIDNCPGTGHIKVYLVASQFPLPTRDVYNGCTGNLKSKYIGEFSKSNLFSKIYHQVYEETHVWREIADTPYGNWVCQLHNGKMAYAIDDYVFTISLTSSRSFSLTELPLDSQEVVNIRNILYYGQSLAAAFKSNDFNDSGYGSNRFTGSWTFTTTARPTDYYCLISRTESKTVLGAFRPTQNCGEYQTIFNVMGTVEENGSMRKYIRVRIPEKNFDYEPF